MKTSITVTEITRENYHEFCTEPELTRDEWLQRHEMAAAARSDEATMAYIDAATEAEREAQDYVRPTKDWADLARSADVWRRLVRAQIAAWREWQLLQTAAVAERWQYDRNQ